MADPRKRMIEAKASELGIDRFERHRCWPAEDASGEDA